MTLSSFVVFAACGDDADDGGGKGAAAGDTSQAGAPAKGGSGGPSAGEGGAAHREGSLACEVLGELCHAADSGSGPAHDCHDVGHEAHADECTAQFAGCVAVCTDDGEGGASGSDIDPKCAALGALCHAAGEIDAEADACHEIGHVGDADACADSFAACATLCLAVLETLEGDGEGGGGSGGGASGGAASAGAGGAP